MKRSVKISELKNHLSEHLRAVEAGDEIVVTDRDRPIARIVPIESATPRLTIIPAERPFSEIRNKKYPRIDWGVDPVEMLLEDRRRR
jgi:prevent-host-death family protein